MNPEMKPVSTALSYSLMEAKDLDELAELEKKCQQLPWSKVLFAEELKSPQQCFWVLARLEGVLVAYMGFWKAVDEAHITNLGVHPRYQRQGIGEAVVRRGLEVARDTGCLKATLEVRPSNLPAVRLYEKLGFVSVAIRPGYYPDNQEDGLIMWKESLLN
jgi:[ribosomal protein S18]-alanine N-acetyltransferase